MKSLKSNSSSILLNLGMQNLPFLSWGLRAPSEQLPITHFPQAFWSQLHGPFFFCHSISNSCPLLQGRYLENTATTTPQKIISQRRDFLHIPHLLGRHAWPSFSYRRPATAGRDLRSTVKQRG